MYLLGSMLFQVNVDIDIYIFSQLADCKLNCPTGINKED